MTVINQQSDLRFEGAHSVHSPSQRAMKRILLVDNQAHVLRVMKSALDRNGYEVDTALSGDVALGMLRETQYDVLIADSELEKLDGQQLISAISEQFRARAPAMFLVTDQNAGELEQWSAAVGRTECMEKPISLRYLVGRLNELFGTYEEI